MAAPECRNRGRQDGTDWVPGSLRVTPNLVGDSRVLARRKVAEWQGIFVGFSGHR
jgi:hypothetical protein